MMAATLEQRWALGHEPIVEVPRPGAGAALSSPPDAARTGLPLASAGGLKGMPIVNLQQEVLGHVEELMLDVQHGRIAYAVMGSGGFFGLGERYFAIPWTALVVDPKGECLVVDVARERFDRAGPAHDAGDGEDAGAVLAWTGGPSTEPGWRQPLQPEARNRAQPLPTPFKE
jgi:sporulation protein YlmC with PRC-barrel domain